MPNLMPRDLRTAMVRGFLNFSGPGSRTEPGTIGFGPWIPAYDKNHSDKIMKNSDPKL